MRQCVRIVKDKDADIDELYGYPQKIGMFFLDHFAGTAGNTDQDFSSAKDCGLLSEKALLPNMLKGALGMQRLFFGWVVSLGIVMGCMVRAEEPVTSIRLITTEWPGYTNQDGTGLYFDVIKAVYEPEGVKVEFELVPWKRAQMLVKTQADALVGEYWLPEEDYLYPQWPLDVEELTVLFKKGSVPAWNGESTLENTNVAWIRGYDFQAYFIVAMAIHEIDELRSGLVMLEKDRIDFLVDYADSIEEEAEHLRKTLNPEFDLAQYQMEPLRIGAKIHVAFVNSARGKTLVEIFERRMAQLFESGVLDAMYRDFEEWDYDGYPK